MADLHKEFISFHNDIALPAARKNSLRCSRDAVRTKIRNHFRAELKLSSPKFHAQGSYAMVTTVVPLDGEYDLDDGVYLQHLDEHDQSEWPTTETVHGWLVEAVNGHTNEPPIDKPTCVRLRYAGAYHLDLPCYAKFKGDYLLAIKGDSQWKKSDPKAITDWFKGRVKQQGEQLRRMVRCLKAWDDHQSGIRGKMANGLILTVLAGRWFIPDADHDDAAFTRMVASISNDIGQCFSTTNPVDASEDLANRLSDARRKRVQTAFAELSEAANEARRADKRAKASEMWRKQFGDRFPLVENDDDEEQKRKDAAALAVAFTPRNPPKPWAPMI